MLRLRLQEEEEVRERLLKQAQAPKNLRSPGIRKKERNREDDARVVG